ncbi:FAD-binding protein [Altererythrobacter sp. SALINAS58]|uniref:FAD-binding oxidoreductase n=1 Tax=Alteripontixanthobacter muriae TaxID=2705546 RepID=UPI00157716EC|nr:FAD-linked oxidase C-terminal domain-containing protein [Alteripontixanthobacter muriae]NTZ43200.1 FAD-binding protein [Alteripontixanthobacter muriae]
MSDAGHTPAKRHMPDGFSDRLRERFGDQFESGDAVLEQHGSSESHYQNMLPDAVIYAERTEDVITLVNMCSDANVPIIPFGAGTSIEGNAAAVSGGISLNMTRMDAIVAVNAEDFDCVVQPGVRREELNQHLRDSGLFFPIDPGANATIGGMASTRASGTNAVRYGTMRDAVLSLRIVTPEGKVIRTARRARKSAAGYDLTRLYVGSEGTLGIIVEITLRLHPIPEAISSAVCSFKSLDGAVDTVVQAIQSGVPLARVEILDALQMRAVNRWSKLDYPEAPTLFFEFHGSEGSVAEQVEIVRMVAEGNGGGEFAWSNLPEERSKLWRARHDAYYAAVNLREGAIGWATDVCVPISRLAECIAETHEDLEASTIPATILGHVGDGNFHVVFSIDPAIPDELEEVARINERLIARALAMDGTCTGEHGIGLGKQGSLVAELGEAVEQMRMIKRAFDPRNILNPGKIFAL